MTGKKDDPAGLPEDGLSVLGSALETAGKAALTSSAGDLTVIAAVELGWLLPELAHNWPIKPQPAGIQLSPEESREAQANELTTQVAALRIAGLTAETKVVGDMVNALKRPTDTLQPAQLNSAIRVALVGAGAEYVCAFVLGQGLRAMVPDDTTQPTGPTTAMIGALDMLSSHLPSHAARSVANSMSSWDQTTDARKESLREAQVALWRAVLVGEKKGAELLEPEDYLRAAGKLEHKYVQQIFASASVRVIAVFATLFFAGGIVALLLESKTGITVAGITGVLAALGLTWKGIGGTVGKIVGKLEAPVWGAELDTAITDAITLADGKRDAAPGVAPPANELGYARRRERALVSGSHLQQLDSTPPNANGARETVIRGSTDSPG